MNCDVCKSEYNCRVRCDQGTWMCMNCYSKKTTRLESGYGIKEVMMLNGSYKVSKARVDEIERRVMIPDSTVEGGYRVGRRMENGTVNSNREPDYRP